MNTSIYRYVVRSADGEGSIYTCSHSCAKSVAEDQQATLVSCEGGFDVDESATCDAGCES